MQLNSIKICDYMHVLANNAIVYIDAKYIYFLEK